MRGMTCQDPGGKCSDLPVRNAERYRILPGDQDKHQSRPAGKYFADQHGIDHKIRVSYRGHLIQSIRSTLFDTFYHRQALFAAGSSDRKAVMSQEQKTRIRNIILRIIVILLLCLLVSRLGRNDKPSGTQNENTQTQSAQTENAQIADSSAQDNTEPANGTSMSASDSSEKTEAIYTFRNSYLRGEHFDKHGDEFDYDSAEEYEKGACAVVNNTSALHKTEAEDGDDVYYIEKTNEFVVVSKDGYIRTYFKPRDGIRYYNRQ